VNPRHDGERISRMRMILPFQWAYIRKEIVGEEKLGLNDV
jgi:hypothetical protein